MMSWCKMLNYSIKEGRGGGNREGGRNKEVEVLQEEVWAVLISLPGRWAGGRPRVLFPFWGAVGQHFIGLVQCRSREWRHGGMGGGSLVAM